MEKCTKANRFNLNISTVALKSLLNSPCVINLMRYESLDVKISTIIIMTILWACDRGHSANAPILVHTQMGEVQG